MLEITKKENWNVYDVLKIISSVLVVVIHTKPFDRMGLLDYGFSFITRFAVPIFFLLSGFFLFNENVSTKKIRRYCTRIFTMYAFWCVIYALLRIDGVNKFTQIIKGGGYSSLWFLQALFVSVILIWCLKKIFKNEWIVFGITLLLYMIGLILSTYGVIFEKFAIVEQINKTAFISFVGTRNGIFYAPIFVVAGMLLRRYLHKMKLSVTVIFTIVFLGVFAAETVLATFILKVSSTIMWVMLLPTTYFICALVGKIKLKDRKIYPFIRKMSTGIYLTHMPICFYLRSYLNGILLFVVVLSLSACISVALALIPRDKFKFVKYLC